MTLRLATQKLFQQKSLFTINSIRNYTAMYTANCTSTGGRDGHAKCNDKESHLNVKLSKPKEMGGSGANGTNPEELFAAGYSGCFLGAMGLAAKNLKKNITTRYNCHCCCYVRQAWQW